MRSEMCSLHLTHPSVHTWSSGQPTVQRPGSSRGLPVGAGIRTHNLGLPRVSSPTLYPLGQRLPRSETIPSSRITPDPLDSQLHVGASSLQFTPLIFYRVQDWNGHSRGLVLCSVTHFCVVFEVCVCIIVQLLEDPNMAHYKISNRVSHLLIFYLLVLDKIHVSKQDVQDLQQKYRPTTSKIQLYISLYTWGTFYPRVHQIHLECLLLKS